MVAGFDGGAVSSDAGEVLLGTTDRAIGLVDRFAACFRVERHPELIEHTVLPRPGMICQQGFDR